MPSLKSDLLRSELKKAIRHSFLELQRQLAGERLYGFSLCLGALGSFVGGYGTSEEGLDRIVDVYRQKGCYQAKEGDLITHLRASLRWNCEDGWLALHDPYFTDVNQLLRASYDGDPDAFYDNGYTRLVYLECLAALADSDAGGVFGRAEERGTVTLNLYLGDQGDEELLRWAVQVNPPGVYKRLRAELAAGNAAHKQLTYSPPKRK